MNEQIKSCMEFENALRKFQKEFRKQNLDQLGGVDLKYNWKWSSELLQTWITDILNCDSLSNKESLKTEFKHVSRKYRTGAMLARMESDYENDDIVHIDGFTIYVIKDFIYEVIAKNHDKLDEFFDYCKLMTRHEFGHCLDYMAYVGMSYKDFYFYQREIRAKYNVQMLEEIQHMDRSRKKMTKFHTLMIDGVPMHYLKFEEIAANKKAGFTPEELKRFYDYSDLFDIR